MDKTALRTAAAKYGTPLYLFDLEAFTARAQRVRAAFGSDVNLCYSMKANPFVLRGLPDVFRWVEVCSPGELTICERLGIPPERILYSGVNKGADDVARAVALGAPFAGARMTGYEIHNGRTTVNGEPFCRLADGTPEGCVCKNVFGTYLHGLFDSGELTEQFAAYLCRRKGIDPAAAAPISMQEYRTQQLDLLADGVRHNLDLAAVYAAMGVAQPAERGNDQ